MKKYLVPLIATTFLLGICVFALSFMSGSCNFLRRSTESPLDLLPCQQASSVVEAYYAALEDGNWKQAFQYVKYFEKWPDRPQAQPYEEMERRWVERVQRLRESNTYLVRAVTIEVTMDDGYPYGVADVVVVEDGQEKTVTHQLHLAPDQDGWKIQSVKSGDHLHPQSELDLALSGHIAP